MMTPEQIEARFERIEQNLERISEAHQELEAAQLNAQKAAERFALESRERAKEQDERIQALIDAQLRTDAHLNRMAEELRRTDAKFETFLERFDRFISGQGGNGHGD